MMDRRKVKKLLDDNTATMWDDRSAAERLDEPVSLVREALEQLAAEGEIERVVLYAGNRRAHEGRLFAGQPRRDRGRDMHHDHDDPPF